MRQVAKSASYVLQALESFEDMPLLEEQWRELEREGRLPLNASFDFYLEVARNLDGVSSPFVLAAGRQSGDRLSALLVGRLSREKRQYSLGYKQLISLPVTTLSFIQGGVCLTEEDPELLRLVGDYLRQRACREAGADLATIHMIRQEHALLQHLQTGPCGWSNLRHPPLNAHWALCLPGSLEELLGTKSSSHRRKTRATLRKMQRDFPDAQVKLYTQPSQLEELFAAVESVASRTYQRGLGAGFRDDSFTRLVFEFHARRGTLKCYVLYLQGKPAAFENGFLHGSRYHAHSVGYEPSFARYSVGTCLWMWILEEFFQEGRVRELDFGLGDADYKRDLCNRRWLESSPCLYDKSPRGAALLLLDSLFGKLSGLMTRTARGWGVEGKIRRRWRARLRERLLARISGSAR